MLRRLVFVLMLLAGLAAMPLARASQACCEHGCDAAMPACAAVCALCATPAPCPEAARLLPTAEPVRVVRVMPDTAFDDWIDEIWHPPD